MEEDTRSGGPPQRSSPPPTFVGQKRWRTPLPPNPTPMTFRHTTASNSPRNPLYAKRAEQKKLVREPPAPTTPAHDPEAEASTDVEEIVASIKKLSEAMTHQEEAHGGDGKARDLAGLLQVCPNIYSNRSMQQHPLGHMLSDACVFRL
jgi:hypothetical protein